MADLAALNARIQAMTRAAAEQQGKLQQYEQRNESLGVQTQTSGSSSGKGTTQKSATSTGSTGADAITQAMEQRAASLAARAQELNRLQEDLNARYAALQSGQSTESAQQLAIEQDRLNDRKVNYERDSAQYGVDSAYYDTILSAAPYIAVERQAEKTGTQVSGGVQALIDTMQQRVNQIDQRRKEVQEEQAALEERARLLQYNTALTQEEREAEQRAINQAVANLTTRQQNLMRDAGVYSEEARSYEDTLIEQAERDMMDFAARQMDAYYDEAAMAEAYEGQKSALYAEWQELNRKELQTGVYGERTASEVWDEYMALDDEYAKQKVEAEEYWTAKQLQSLSEKDLQNLETIVQSEFGETAFTRNQPGRVKNEQASRAYQELYAKYSYQEVESYLQIVRREENAKTGAIMQETVRKLTKEKPVAANVAIALTRIPATIGAAAEFAGQIVNNPAGYRTLDIYGAGNVLQNAGRTVQQTTTEQIKEKLGSFWGGVASGAYQLGMSTVDSLAAVGTGTGLLLAANAATNTMQNITERGGTIGQAVVGGILAGAAEAVFEKVSIENFQALSQKEVVRTVQDWVSNVAKSMATNASEEMATEFANIVADSIVMGEFSTYAEAVRELMAQNPEMSEDEAKMRVAGQMGLQILGSGASGAIMGGFFGLLGSGMAQHRTGLRDGMVSGAIAQGLGYEGSEAFQIAAGLQVQLNEGFEVSDEDLGRLIAANQVQADERTAAGANVEQAAAATSTEEILTLPEAMGEIAEAMPEVQETTSGEDMNVRTEEVQAEASAARETVQEETRQEVVAPTAQEAEREESPVGNIPARVEEENAAEGVTVENALRRVAKQELQGLAEEYQGEEFRQAAQNLANDMRMAGHEEYAEAIETAAEEMIQEPTAVSANNVRTAPKSTVQTEGVQYGGEESGVRLRDGGERNDGQSPGGQTGAVAEAAGRAPAADERRQLSAKQSLSKRVAERISRGGGQSTRTATGLNNAMSSGAPVYVLEEQDMSPEEYGIVNDAAANGYRVKLMVGKMTFRGANGRQVKADGARAGDDLFVSVNGDFSGRQIANHEMFHSMAADNPGLIDAIMEEVLSGYDEAELEQLMQAYADLYDGAYDEAEMLTKIAEEICADAYAGMDRVNFGKAQAMYAKLTDVTGAVRELTERRTGLRAIGERGVQETRARPKGTKNAPEEAEGFSLASGQSREQVEERISELEGLMENLMTEQETMDPAEFNVRWFNFQMEKAALESELYDEEQQAERQRLREEAKAKRERDAVALEKIEKYRTDVRKYKELADKAEKEYEKTEEAKFLESAKKYRDLQKEFQKKANDLQREIRGKVDVKNATRVYKPTEAIKRTENRILDLFKIQAGNRGEARQALTGVLLDTLERGYVGQEALEAVLRKMYQAGIDVVPAEEIYQDIAATLKGSKIYVSDGLKNEYGDDWKNVRGKLLGLGIYTTSDRAELGVDSVYAELAGQYPGVFDEENVDMRGMLDEILEAASMGRTTHMTLADSAAVQGLDSEEDFWNLYRLAGEELARFADAAGVESRVRSKKEWQIAMEQAEHSAKENKILKASRERADEIRRQEQGKRQAMIAKRQRVEMMDKLRRQIERLNRKVERNDQLTKVALSNLGKDVVNTAKLAMGTVDLISNGFRKSTQKDLLALKESIGLAKDAPGFEEDALAIIKNALVNKKAYKDLTEGQIDEKAKARLNQALVAIDRLEKRQLTDMSIDDLSAMYDAIGAIIHEIDSIDNMLGEEWDRTVDEAANQIREEVGKARGVRDNLRGKTISEARHLLAEQSLSPSRMLARLVGYDRSGAMGKAIREFEQGDLAAMKYALDADLIFDRFLKDKKNREWLNTATGKKAKMVEVEIPKVLQYGEGDAPIYDPKEKVSFQVSQMMLVQMSLDLQNEANTRHAEKGGYTIPDPREYQKGNYEEAYNKGKTVMIPRERLEQIVKENLSEEGQEYAKLLHRYYNGVGKEAINAVSQKLNGVDVARVRNYYPIHTDQAYRGQEYNVFDATLESMGSLKERKYSESPILLEDAADTFRHHRDQMARYVGYAVARRNFVSVLNHRNAGGITLRAEIEGKWGTTAGKSLDEFFRILETGQLEEVKDILSGLQSKYAGAVINYNVGSMMKQLGALPMAGSTVGHGAVLRGMLHPTKMGAKQREFIRKYTPYLDYRGKGYTYREMAEAAGKNIHSESLDKTFDYLLGRNWLEAMDIKVNTALWHAAEYAVRRDTKLQPGSQEDIEAGIDPYYKAVADVFNRMTHDTQTNYNMMARPPVLMRQGLMIRAFTMFRTDAYQVTGAMRENLGAWQQARRSYKNAETDEAKTAAREQIKTTAKGAARTMAAVVGNAMISVIVDELRQLIRGNDEDYFDEDGKFLMEEAATKIGKDVLMNIAGSFMFVEELAEYLEAKITGDRYYEPEVGRIGMLVDAAESLWKMGATIAEVFQQATAIRKDGGDVVAYLDHEWDNVFGVIRNTAVDGAYLVGSPLKNFERTVTTALGWILPEAKIAYNDMFTDYSKALLRDMGERELPYGIDAYLRDNCSITDDQVRDEYLRLYQAVGDEMMPGAEPPDKIKVGEGDEAVEQETTLSDRGRWDSKYREVMIDETKALIESEAYRSLTDEEKAEALALIDKYAEQVADQLIGVEADAWVRRTMAARVDPGDVVAYKAATGGMKAAESYAWIAESGLTEAEAVAVLGVVMQNADGHTAGYTEMQKALENGLELSEWAELYAIDDRKVESLNNWMADGLGKETALLLAESTSGLEPEDGKEQVSDMQKYRAIDASGMTEEQKADAMSVLLGMEMETESGKPSQRAKMLEILGDGNTMKEYLDLKEADQVDAYLKAKDKGIELDTYVELSKAKQVDNYLEAVELGLSEESAYKAVMAVAALPELPEGDSYDTSDKQAAAVEACSTVEEQIIAYAAYGDKKYAASNTVKFTTAAAYDVSPAIHLQYKNTVEKYNTGSENVTQDEATAAIRSMEGLTNDQKAVLWQLANSGWSYKKNPFSASIGREFKGKWDAAKE